VPSLGIGFDAGAAAELLAGGVFPEGAGSPLPVDFLPHPAVKLRSNSVQRENHR
jgi:hypothetical protein